MRPQNAPSGYEQDNQVSLSSANFHHSIPTPALAEIERIASSQELTLRNLQITQCYYELSTAFAQRLGLSANWCTFATWASKQAGQTIRKEDLVRTLDERLQAAPLPVRLAENSAVYARLLGSQHVTSLHDLVSRLADISQSIALASLVVSRGNQKVFAEIAPEFARFYRTFLQESEPPASAPDAEQIARFCEALRPGDPPEGQGYLRRAFYHYYQALFEPEPKRRAEWILLANIEIGFHEQTRLQPEIAESLEAGLITSLKIGQRLLAGKLPFGSAIPVLRMYMNRLLGRPTVLELALRLLQSEIGLVFRRTLTDLMMSLNIAGQRLKLGADLLASFPPGLQVITNPELLTLLQAVDPTPDSTLDSGARDWANLPDRLHFIIDLFRCYQEQPNLLEPPFTAGQISALKAGQVPDQPL